MSERRQLLKQFLTTNGVSQGDIGHVMSDLEPYYQQAEAGRKVYAADPDPEEIKKALILATGQAVNKVVFVSLSGPWSMPEWMPRKVYNACIVGSVRSSIEPSLWHVLRVLFQDGPHGLGAGLGVRYGVGSSLQLRIGLASCLKDGLGANLEDSVGIGLYYYVGFVMAGKMEVAMRLMPLVRVSARNPILGEKIDEPGIWVALKA